MKPDPKKFKIVREHKRKDILFSVHMDQKSNSIFCGSSDSKIHLLNARDEKPQSKALEGGHTSYVSGIAQAGPHLVSGAWDKKLIWWNAKEGMVVKKIDAHDKWIRAVSASPDGKWIASTSDDMIVKLWNAASQELVKDLKGHAVTTPTDFPSMLFTARFSPDSKYLASADKIGDVIIWDLESKKELVRLKAPELYTWDDRQRFHSIGGARSVCFSPDGTKLAVSGVGKIGNVDGLGGKARISVFDWKNKKKLIEFQSGQQGLVNHLEFSHDGKWVLGGGGNQQKGFFIFLDLEAEKPKAIHEVQAPMHVHEFAFSEDQLSLQAVGHQKVLYCELKAPAPPAEKKT